MKTSEFPIVVTARHLEMTEAIRSYAETKLRRFHIEYPRIMEAKVILDAQPHGHIATIVLHCANHVVLEADTETRDLYEAFDLTVDKIERQMRKEKTRYQRKDV